MSLRLFQRSPPALRVKPAGELHPDFRPKWVWLRRVMFAVSGVLAVGFLVATVAKVNAVALLCLILVWGLMSVAVPMPHLPTLLRLMTRPMPKRALQVERFLTWLEFDLDWDEARR